MVKDLVVGGSRESVNELKPGCDLFEELLGLGLVLFQSGYAYLEAFP